ncbi:hypothetical protein IWQ56_001606 [Coemansia nantahalensis]|nr:hypothetical protein IWQ56_001606 [Coemansia nantahalensis]
MSERRLRPGGRSTWITTRGFRSGEANSDGSDSDDNPVVMPPPRIGPAPAIWQPFGLTSSMFMNRTRDAGGDGESDSNSDEDGGGAAGGEGPALYHGDGSGGDDVEEEEEEEEGEDEGDHDEDHDHDEGDEDADVYTDGHSDVEMHTMVVAMEDEGDSDASGSDGDAADDMDGDAAEHGRRGRNPAWRANMASFEDLPSLVNPAPRQRAPASARRPHGKGRNPAAPFIPKYLESTAYGALYRRLVVDGEDPPNGAESDDKAGAVGGAAAEAARVAPDMFFQTLVQDTWPHYCVPVPTMPPFVGLRVGLGLGIGGQGSGQSGAGPDVALAGAGAPQRSDAQGRGEKGGASASQALQLPSGWAMPKTSRNLEVEADRATVRYTGPGRRDTDAAMLLSDVCIPPRTGVYYFEMTVKSRGQCGYIGLGLANPGLSLARLPGWDNGSWGYHGDDGNGFSGGGHGLHFGPRFTTGDTVGCGINFMRRRIFFTLNGAQLGYAFEPIDTDRDLHPCVGMRTPGERVSANFGRAPFVFDIDHFVVAAREEALRLVARSSLGTLLPSPKAAAEAASASAPVTAAADLTDAAGALGLRAGCLGATPHKSAVSDADAALSIVLTHLLHSECYATARALIVNAVGQRSLQAEPGARSSERETAEDPRLLSVLQMLSRQEEQRGVRRRICQHICDGEIDAALGMLQEAHPRVLADESLVFQLRCRQFIELVRAASGQQISDCVPSDGGSLAPPLARVHAGQASSMMDVDDTQSASVLSLAAITTAPSAPRQLRFGQIGRVGELDLAQLVRVLLEYGRQLQADYGSSPNPVIREGLVHTFSLLAYADPAQSPIAALLDPAACQPLARLVDMAIVATETAPRMSSLECIYRQASTLLGELSLRRNGAASLVSIERDFRVPDAASGLSTPAADT